MNLLSAVVFLLSACLFIYVAVRQGSIVYRCMSGVAAFFVLVSSGCFYKAYLLKNSPPILIWDNDLSIIIFDR